MLRIIEGAPGSGKSYYAVNYLSSFVRYDKVYDTYIVDNSLLVITNIDSIRIKHISVDTFFSTQLYKTDNFLLYMKENNYKRAIVIVDECQRHFSSEILKKT